jgi:hypothetical protein
MGIIFETINKHAGGVANQKARFLFTLIFIRIKYEVSFLLSRQFYEKKKIKSSFGSLCMFIILPGDHSFGHVNPTKPPSLNKLASSFLSDLNVSEDDF